MGTLSYDSHLQADFEDRLLAHLQIVIGAKLRRNEAFYFSWKDDQSIGNGRSCVWIHPTIALSFKYFGSRPPAINREWVDELMLLANTAGGLHPVPEPAPGSKAAGNGATTANGQVAE